MADSELKLPGPFDEGKSYTLKGSTLNDMRRALLADRVVAGAGLLESGTPQGRILKVRGAGKHLNLEIQDVYESSSDFSSSVGSSSYLYWRDGDFVGDTDPGDAPAGLIEKRVTNYYSIS
jgi:hypothetical protein